MTTNQVVAYNVAKARTIRGWTQEQAAEELAPYLEAKLSTASFSALERSAWNVNRIKQFSADEMFALARGFDLPIGFFFTPPPPSFDAALSGPDAGMKGLDPIVLLDAVLGTPDNIGHWEAELLTYSASVAPTPRSKRDKPNVAPRGLAQRLEPLGALRAKALLRQAFGELADASGVLERLAEALRTLDESAVDDTADTRAVDPAQEPPATGRKGGAR